MAKKKSPNKRQAQPTPTEVASSQTQAAPTNTATQASQASSSVVDDAPIVPENRLTPDRSPLGPGTVDRRTGKAPDIKLGRYYSVETERRQGWGPFGTSPKGDEARYRNWDYRYQQSSRAAAAPAPTPPTPGPTPGPAAAPAPPPPVQGAPPGPAPGPSVTSTSPNTTVQASQAAGGKAKVGLSEMLASGKVGRNALAGAAVGAVLGGLNPAGDDGLFRGAMGGAVVGATMGGLAGAINANMNQEGTDMISKGGRLFPPEVTGTSTKPGKAGIALSVGGVVGGIMGGLIGGSGKGKRHNTIDSNGWSRGTHPAYF